MVSKVERLHICLPNFWVEVPTGHAKGPLYYHNFSGGENINFTVPPPNQLLNPFLSTSRSGEFRTGLTNEKSVCLPTQILHWSSCNPVEKKIKIGAECLQLKIWISKHAPTLLLTPFLNTSDWVLLRTGFKSSWCFGNMSYWASKVGFWAQRPLKSIPHLSFTFFFFFPHFYRF